jgi:spore germination protein KA
MLKKLLKKVFKGKDIESRKGFEAIDLEDIKDLKISQSLERNHLVLKEIFNNCSDIVFKNITLNNQNATKALLIFTEGITNKELLDSGILTPLLRESDFDPKAGEDLLDIISNKIVNIGDIVTNNNIEFAVKGILTGNVVLLVEGVSKAISLGIPKWEMRSIEEPPTEPVMKGAREGFTETLKVNTSLLRRRIVSPKLKIVEITLGRYSQTRVNICYVEGIAKEKLITEVKERLERIDIDGVIFLGKIEELIEDNYITPFNLIMSTERPDNVASAILEGRVAILTDTVPFCLLVPVSFFDHFVSIDDYGNKFIFASLLKLIRYLALFFTLFLPALYVSAISYHPEMIPTVLIISILAQREGVPFPAVFEAFIMGVVFAILQEAGIRMPRHLGQAISIVGALIIGQSAVEAGLISPFMVIVIALTGVSSFVLPAPELTDGILIFRLFFLIGAAFWGVYGVIMVFFSMLIHLSSLRSFGYPYMAPVGPTDVNMIKEFIVRAPVWTLTKRDAMLTENTKKQREGLKPKIPKGDNEDS